MTSNIGTSFVKYGGTLGFLKQDGLSGQERQLRDNIERDLKQTFRPEFLNRIDEIIIFHGLTQEHVKQIVDLQMHEVAERLGEHGLKIELTEAARDWLAHEGYDPQFGATVRRTLERHVENELAKRLLAGEFVDGDVVVVDAAEGAEGKPELVFHPRPQEPIAVELPVTAA
jgi:ATP-dependent Clp protease ATP-binding subunit ClpC